MTSANAAVFHPETLHQYAHNQDKHFASHVAPANKRLLQEKAGTAGSAANDHQEKDIAICVVVES